MSPDTAQLYGDMRLLTSIRHNTHGGLLQTMRKWTVPVMVLAVAACITVAFTLPATAEHDFDAFNEYDRCLTDNAAFIDSGVCDGEFYAWIDALDDHAVAAYTDFHAADHYDLPSEYASCLEDVRADYDYAMRNIRDRESTGLGSVIGLGGHMSVIASDAGSSYIAEVSVCNTAYLASLQ